MKITRTKYYRAELSNGDTSNVPSGKARTRYEYVSDYGLQAILERARRSRAFKSALARNPDTYIRAIITPSGEYVTQF